MRLLALRPLCTHHIPTWPTPDLGFCQRHFPKSRNLVRGRGLPGLKGHFVCINLSGFLG